MSYNDTALDTALDAFSDKLRRFNRDNLSTVKVVSDKDHVLSIYHTEHDKPIIYDKAHTLLVKRSK